MHHYIVAYDIASPGRLRRVHKVVRDFGDALQRSVFHCRLRDADHRRLVTRLTAIIDVDADQILLTRLGPVGERGEAPPRCEVLGRPLDLSRTPVVI